MKNQLQIADTVFSSGPLPAGTVLTPVNLFDGNPFFLETGPDGEAVMMMNWTKEDQDSFEYFWRLNPTDK